MFWAGEWTEEEEEVVNDEVTKKSKPNVLKSEEKPPAIASTKTRRNTGKKDEGDGSKNEKGNSDSAKNILDDWDSQEKFDEDGEKVSRDMKITSPIEQTTDSDSKSTSEKVEKKQAEEKNELKTLINDWGDEDEEAF